MNMEYEKILYIRLLFAFLWVFALHLFPLSLYIFVTNFDIVHPLEWLVNSTLLIFSIGTWISLLPIHIFVFGLGYVLSQEHKRPPTMLTSKFKLLCNFFTKNNILKLFLYIVIGFLFPWTYLKFNDYSLTKQCQNSTRNLCIDERSVFLVSSGMWTAVYYFSRFDVLSPKYLQFPIIRQLRFLQIRSKYPKVFQVCFKTSFVPLFYFILFYCWYEKEVLSLFEVFTSANMELSALKIFSAFNVSFLIKAWLISSLYLVLIETLVLMIQIHYTEHYSFALIKPPGTNAVLLQIALGEQNIPIIQHLACYDLYNISISQKSIRWQVFTLSQPGGHPHTWNAILHESLKLIDRFICELQEINKVPEPERPKPIVPKHFHSQDMTLRQKEIFSGPVPLSPSAKIRNLVDYPHQIPPKQQQSAIDEIQSKIEFYMTILQQNSIINYIFGSKPDVKIRYLMLNCQPLIWVIQSISELSANALMEDQFGIVLKDLPLIINTLLRLKFSLDKLGNLQKKFQKRDHELCMKASLKSALRRSLYRIAIAYSDYLTDLPLPPENLCCMQNFVKFKEC